MQALAVEAVSAQPLQLQQAQGSASAADRGCAHAGSGGAIWASRGPEFRLDMNNMQYHNVTNVYVEL